MSLDSDRPIGHPDGDALGLAPFAQALARALTGLNPRDGLALAVEGAWGAGKSSALALAEREIRIIELERLGASRAQLDGFDADALDRAWTAQEAERLVRIVRFNPWTWSGQDNLTRAFFAELSAQIDHDPDGKVKKAARAVGAALSYGGVLAAASALPAIVALPGIGALAKPAGDFAKATGDALKAVVADAPSLGEAKKALATALREAGGRVIVFIDDLDRLMPAEMRAMLSLVKSLGDLPNVIYVLAYDPQVLRKGLESERVDQDFTTKIVQVVLKLPPPRQQDMRELFKARLAAATGGAAFADEPRWASMSREAVEPYLRTPRDIARLVNAVQVHWAAVDGEVDLADLVTLTTLRLFEPKVYRLIEEENERFVGVEGTYDLQRSNAFFERLKKTEPKVAAAATMSVAALYPDLSRVLSDSFESNVDRSLRRAHRRVCIAGHHRAYFAFAPEALTPRRAEVDAILYAADPAPAFAALAETAEEDYPRAFRVLEEVEAQLHRGPLLSEALLSATLDASDALLALAQRSDPFLFRDMLDLLATIIREGGLQLDASERSVRLQRIVRGGSGLTLRVQVVAQDARAHHLIAEEERGGAEPLFERAAIATAVTTLAAQIAAASEDGSIWSAPSLRYLLQVWRALAGRDAPANWVAALPDERLAAWALAIISQRRQTGKSGMRETDVFHRQHYQELFDVEPFLARLAARAKTDENAADALAALTEAERSAAHF